MDYINELLTFVLGAGATYLGLHWKVKKDLIAEHDRMLREARLQVYQTLWNSLEPLAKYSRPAAVTFQTLIDLSAELRRWYFADGGIYLSTITRDAYFELQNELSEVIGGPESRQSTIIELDEQLFKKIRKIGSKLRTAMARDVGTRLGSLIDPDD